MGSAGLEFLFAAVLIGIAGSHLSRTGDALAATSRLGETGVGLFLLAVVTSLPELAIGVSAVALAGSADLAVGAVLGSCVFNLAILALVDAVHRGSLFRSVSRDHALAAAFGLVLIGVAAWDVIAASYGANRAWGHLSLASPVLLGIYLLAARTLTGVGAVGQAGSPFGRPASSRDVRAGFAFASLAVVATGIWLPFVGERLVVQLGVQETFVGTLFMAFATSLPEMVVTLAAARIGALDMAVANLLGSNLFNVLILVPEDLIYTRGPLLAAVSPLHALSALSAMVMTGVAIVGFQSRPRRRGRLSTASWVLLAVYLVNTVVLYVLDHPPY